MRIDVMVDIETLGNKADSTIIQVASIAFDINTGKHFSEFNQIVDIEQISSLNVTGSTIKWWLNTNKELLQSLINIGQGSDEDMLKNFHGWLINLKDKGDIYLWGNGILFDNKIIQYHFERIGLNYPVHYKHDRDVRTIVDLACTKLGISEKELKEKFKDENLVKHNALDDVRYQIKLVCYCYKTLIS